MQDEQAEAVRLDAVRLEVARLEEEAKECVSCMDRPKTNALIPCGHKCLCEGCSQGFMARRDPCLMCRGPPDGCIRVFD